MCERIGCKAKGKYWVRRDSANLIVCGRHLPGEVTRMREWNSLTAHPSCNLVTGSQIIVKMKNAGGCWV